jgi:DNA-binding transcriptional regulator YhcF (GntR family)
LLTQREPRYRQIVTELRRRIETGEFGPGDRVPSTRDIIREWGVAMATATKVLTELRNAGLVRVVPGVGTVVDPDRRRSPAISPSRQPRGASPALTSELIVQAAIAVADTEGLPALSMRRVAAEIGVATMSLYRHVIDKDDLVARMQDAVFATWTWPDDLPGNWRDRLELAARKMWSLFRQHAWLASAMSLTRPEPIPHAVPVTEWVLTTMDNHGVDLQTAFTVHLTIFNYVRGTAVNVELETEAEAQTGMDNEAWMVTRQPALRRLLTAGRLPRFERLIDTGYDFDLDALFEFGLQRILDGLAILIPDG